MKTLVIAITGPSDFGKGIILEKILSRSDEFKRIISHTDRPKRKDEIEGAEFHFVSEKEFTNMVQDEKFLEWQVVPSNGYRYGKTREEVERVLQEHAGKVVFTRMNVINLPVLKRHLPHAKSIFIDLKDTGALIEHLKKNAGIDSEDEFERRFKFATEERRRRHLADITITRKESDEEIVDEIVKYIERFRH